jgi:hypothetical protein
MKLHCVHRSFLALLLCVTALPAVAQIYPGFDASTPIHVVYRVEVTPPRIAFLAGFTARGATEDLLSLTSGVPCNNANPAQGPAWVTMTADREQAVRFARRHLDRMPVSGPNYPIYLYTIRADATFISVPGAFYSAIEAGRADRAGYSPEHANALEYLLYTRPILGERAVVATQVRSSNIANATALWLEGGSLVESGRPTDNFVYMHDPSSVATNVVPDGRLPSLLPPHAILSSEGWASGTCAMACDRATSASSFSLPDQIDYAAQCSQSDAIPPLLLDVIND